MTKSKKIDNESTSNSLSSSSSLYLRGTKKCYTTKNCAILPWKKRHSADLSLNDLPTVVMIKIFSFLPLTDLYLNVRLVCRHWYVLAATPSLWNTIVVGPEVSTRVLLNWLYYAPKLKSLTIENRLDAGNVLRQVQKYNRNIKNIKLHDCWGSENRINLPSEPLCNILLRCPYLDSISLRGSKFISCKFFRLLATRDKILEKRKKNIDHSRRARKIQYFGGALRKQLQVFLQARLQMSRNKLALMNVENVEQGKNITRQEVTLYNEQDIDRILNSLKF